MLCLFCIKQTYLPGHNFLLHVQYSCACAAQWAFPSLQWWQNEWLLCACAGVKSASFSQSRDQRLGTWKKHREKVSANSWRIQWSHHWTVEISILWSVVFALRGLIYTTFPIIGVQIHICFKWICNALVAHLQYGFDAFSVHYLGIMIYFYFFVLSYICVLFMCICMHSSTFTGEKKESGNTLYLCLCDVH